MMCFGKISSLIALLLAPIFLAAQPEFNMSNFTTDECEGILFDSEANSVGDFPTGYDGNEDLTFTICVPGTDEITITFDSLDTEIDRDILSIYDGADKNAPLIGSYSGQLGGFTVRSTGECLTLHFVSDGSKQFEGWRAVWTVNPPEPVVPRFTFISNISCGDQSFTVRFDEPIPCSEIRPDNFTFTGPAGGTVATATPVNCVDGETTEAILTFTDPLNESGIYQLDLDYILSNCVRPFAISLDTSFSITDCPLELEMVTDTSVCEGFCITIQAFVTGGNPNNYQYTWTPNESNTDEITLCPSTPTTVSLTVTDGASQPVSASTEITILPLPEAGPDFSVCEFAIDTNLTGTPAGGFWNGPGIINQANGTFRPRNARDGQKLVYYIAPNGCYDSLSVTVHDVNAGRDLAACLNDNPFVIQGIPAGGTWQGTGVLPDGTFDPNAGGVFTLSYTEAINGCVDQMNVEVFDSTRIPPMDSMVVCLNQADFDIPHYPRNGRWTGNGIINANTGRFRASNAGEGTYMLYYQLASGCIDSTNITVSDIRAGIDTLVCPLDEPFIISGAQPTGGVWTGTGVIDNGDDTYNFNPMANGPNSSVVVLTYTIGDCSASKSINLVRTNVDNVVFDFCEYDGPSQLDLSNVNTSPAGGTWFASFYNNDSINATSLGVGTHFIYYNFNGNQCLDSVTVNINAKPLAGFMGNDTSVCLQSPDFNIIGSPNDGTWDGPGIIDANNGTFSPASLAVNGTFFIEYTLDGCSDTMVVTIADPVPQIRGLAESYCINGNTHVLSFSPAGGFFTGRGIVNPSGVYSPDVAGPGIDTVVYTVGSGACTFRDTAFTLVHQPISGSMQFEYRNPICFGDSMPIRVIATGGLPDFDLSYNWNLSGIGNQAFGIHRPSDNDSVPVEIRVRDFCSYDLVLRDTIAVHPEISYQVTTGPPLCYGDSNWVKIRLTGVGAINQEMFWFEDQSFAGDSLFTIPDRYPLTIIDTVTQCQIFSSERIPEYPLVIADFSITPNVECVDIINPNIYIINNSKGADRGLWTIGEDAFNYDTIGNFDYEFADTANYVISLRIENEIGCADSMQRDICVETVKQYFLSNTFTPNGDGLNDAWPSVVQIGPNHFVPKGFNIIDYEMEIFNRGGELMYANDKSNNPPWDGTVMGTDNPATSGIYVYRMKIFFATTEIIEITGKVVLLKSNKKIP